MQIPHRVVPQPKRGGNAEVMDRLSLIPDSLLCIILSKLPLRDALRCSLVSRRWRYLWVSITHLKISPYFLLTTSSLRRTDAMRNVERIVSDILIYHCTSLESFDLSYDGCQDAGAATSAIGCFRIDKIWRWTRCAAFRNVQEITLKDTYECLCGDHPQKLPASLFSCLALKSLHVEGYGITQIPSYFEGFERLTECFLEAVELNDGAFEKLVTLCPLLQKLNVELSHGLENPRVSSPNISHLRLRLIEYAGALTVNCPRLVELVADNFDRIQANTLGLHCLCGALLKATMVEGNPLIGLELNSLKRLYRCFNPVSWITGRTFKFRTLKKLSLCGGDDLAEEEGNLLDLLASLPLLEDLSVHGTFVRHFAANDVRLVSTSVLDNLKKVRADVHKLDEKEISLLGCLLRSAPKLQIMTLIQQTPCEPDNLVRFLKSLLGLDRASAEAKIIIK